MTYQALSDLLTHPPLGHSAPDVPAFLESACHLVHQLSPHVSDRLSALCARATSTSVMRWKRLFRGNDPAVPLQCAGAQWSLRESTCRELGLDGRCDVVEDLHLLARLDQASATALAEGDERRAVTLLDLEARFVRDHACDCLDRLSDQLRLSGDPFFEQLGWVLAALIEEHLAELDEEAPLRPFG